MNNTTPMRILILGGGFAGLTVAMELERKLARDPSVEITLINRENFFLFTPMLHEVAASDLDLTTIVNPVRKMLRRVNFLAGEVDQIDLEQKRVIVSHGFDHHPHTLEFDFLVFGLGSVTNTYGLPGVQEHALTMKSLGDAMRVRNHLIAHLEEADSDYCKEKEPLLTFVVAGGGFAGVETVAGINDFVDREGIGDCAGRSRRRSPQGKAGKECKTQEEVFQHRALPDRRNAAFTKRSPNRTSLAMVSHA